MSEKPRNEEPLREEKKRVCLVCGYMWDVYKTEHGNEPKKCPSCSSIRWNDASLKRHQCKQCSHRWMSKLESPLMCPKCKSKRWNKDIMKYTCGDCGSITNLNKLPGRCSNCGSENLYSGVMDCICKKCGFVGKTDIRRKGLCPVCRTKLSIRDYSATTGVSGVKRENLHLEISSDVLKTLRSETDDLVKMVKLTNRNGLGQTDSEILILHHKGESSVDIARATDASLNRVIAVIESVRLSEER